MKSIVTALLLATAFLLAVIPARAANDLPGRGATVPLPTIREICLARGWSALWQKIEANPPPRPFVVGSCADWSERWATAELYLAWFRHGLEYWAGAAGDELARLQADTALMLAVAESTHSPEAGVAIFNRVRLSGAAQSDNAFAWAFGYRPDPATVKPPTLREKIVAKLRPVDVPKFVRTYEPTQLGITKDSRDEAFMDFQLSMMFPIYGTYPEEMPAALTPGFRFGDFDFTHPNLFAAATIRAGQYIETRPSSPVVGKRFNPQLFVRFWALDRSGLPASPEKYLDLIFFGHESNGQAISTPAEFLAQQEVYRSLEKHPNSPNAFENSARWAHDSISRGWDYIGTEVGWSWKARDPILIRDTSWQVERALRVKVRYFLPWGLAQKHAEQYYAWEGDGPAHPRRNYDGLRIQYIALSNALGKVPLFTGRGTFTYTTGLSHPFDHSTFEADFGFKIGALPLSLWGRIGYNSDLSDYYRLESGYGFRLSIWQY